MLANLIQRIERESIFDSSVCRGRGRSGRHNPRVYIILKILCISLNSYLIFKKISLNYFTKLRFIEGISCSSNKCSASNPLVKVSIVVVTTRVRRIARSKHSASLWDVSNVIRYPTEIATQNLYFGIHNKYRVHDVLMYTWTLIIR